MIIPVVIMVVFVNTIRIDSYPPVVTMNVFKNTINITSNHHGCFQEYLYNVTNINFIITLSAIFILMSCSTNN